MTSLINRALLLGFLVKRMRSAESAVLLDLHPVGMSLLILGRIVVTLLALSACQSDFCPHFLYLRVFFFNDILSQKKRAKFHLA